MYMIENGGAREDDDDFQSPLDMLFEALEEEEPDLWPCGSIRFSSRPPEKQPRAFY